MRKLGLFVTFWTALLYFPLSSFALGLGEIEVSSFLNQSLKAEIEVISARPGEVDDLLVSLASRDAFNKAGLERPGDLSRLRFKVEKSEDGQSAKILITTKTPIKEPFLNFLVEADWAKGRLLREFTVLLDPPYFAQQSAPQVTAQQTQPAEQTAPVASTPAPAAESSAMAEPMAEPMAEEAAVEPESTPIALATEPEEESIPYVADNAYLDESSANEIVVGKGDTLWGLASQFKDDDHSMAQVMLAMQAMNPDAFGNDNINNLKVGAVLRAPDQQALNGFTKQESYAQVLEQNGLWDDYVARKTGQATSGSPVADAEDSASEEESGQLSLLAPGDGESETASLQNEANSENAGQIRKQLAFAEEELEAARIENDDLKSRISDLEQQINKFEELQKLVQIEDDSLATIQDNVVSETMQPMVEGEAEEESMMPVEQPTEVMIEAADEIMAEQTDEMVMPEESETDSEMMAEEESDTVMEQTDATEMSETETMTEDEEVTEMVEESETEAEKATVPAPVIVTEQPDSVIDGGALDMFPSMGDLLSDPVMLGGIGAILALLLGFVFLKRKKSDSEDESGITIEESEGMADDDVTPIHVPTAEDAGETDETSALEETETAVLADTEQHMADTLAVEADSEVDDDEEDEFNKTAVLSADEVPDAQAAPEDQDDVLNEVDVYLAYGLYDNAEELLKESLESTPDRADYRAKLLDTFFATKNADGFVKEAEALKSLGSAADRFWNRVQVMGFELAPDNALFADAKDSGVSVEDLEYAKPEAADFDIGADEDITDFSNTDFDLGDDSESFDLQETELGSAEDAEKDTLTFAPDGDEFTQTQALSDDADLPDFDLGEGEETNLREETSVTDNVELPDEIGDFDLDLGSESVEEDLEDEDALNFDLPDDLDLSPDEPEEVDESLIPLDPTVEAPKMDKAPEEVEDISEEVEIDIAEDDVVADEITDDIDIDLAIDEAEAELGETVVIEPEAVEADDDIEATAVISSQELEEEIEEEGTRHIEAALDMDMADLENADLNTGVFEPSEDLGLADDDITEFKPAEVTGEFSAFDADAAIAEIDSEAGLEKTGTFAPGDFTDETSSVADSDEIEDLMLPDDVDEVSTKLDLAKAFIDMGDAEGARGSLEEILSEGTQEQKAEATGLLKKIN